MLVLQTSRHAWIPLRITTDLLTTDASSFGGDGRVDSMALIRMLRHGSSPWSLAGGPPNRNIQWVAWRCSLTSPNCRKPGPKQCLLFRGLSVMEWSQTVPLAIWTGKGAIQELSLPWKQLATVWMAASGKEWLGGRICACSQSLLLGVLLFSPL